MNSEIAPENQVVYFCDACDLEVDHDGDCWVEGEDDDEEYWESRRLDDLSDDAEALASIGWGTDEDYGYYGDDY